MSAFVGDSSERGAASEALLLRLSDVVGVETARTRRPRRLDRLLLFWAAVAEPLQRRAAQKLMRVLWRTIVLLFVWECMIIAVGQVRGVWLASVWCSGVVVVVDKGEQSMYWVWDGIFIDATVGVMRH